MKCYKGLCHGLHAGPKFTPGRRKLSCGGSKLIRILLIDYHLPFEIAYLLLFCSALCNAMRIRRELVLENLALRHQLLVLSRSSRRPRLRPADRLFWSWLARHWTSWRSVLVLVQPAKSRGHPLNPLQGHRMSAP